MIPSKIFELHRPDRLTVKYSVQQLRKDFPKLRYFASYAVARERMELGAGEYLIRIQ